MEKENEGWGSDGYCSEMQSMTGEKNQGPVSASPQISVTKRRTTEYSLTY